METMTEVRQLCESFVINERQSHVLYNVNLSIYKRELIAVMGSSGGGKFTLLYTISDMDHINSGTVEFDHKETDRCNEMEMMKLHLHEMDFIFQQMHFLSNLSVYNNVILPDYMAKKRKRKEVSAYADELLRKFQITSIAGHNIQEVNGGKLQRARIARAMINQSQILFTDEPAGALNSSNAKGVMDMFLKVHKQGTTILMVTHNVKVASYAQRICYISDGEIESNLDIDVLKRADKLREREKKVHN